jgi:poly-gamma-glutamate synthesis protein (capsule biosynthesis protein)
VADHNGQNVGVSNDVSVSLTTTNSASSTPTPEKIVENKVRIMIAGDIMLDRGIRMLGEKYGYDSLFATVTPLFKQADLVIANLEGPITTNKSKTLISKNKTGPSLIFTFDPKVTDTISKSNISILSLANNHSDNFGLSGLKQTKNFLDKAGLKYFGDPYNATSTILKLNKNGIDIAFVGYHAFAKGFENIVDAVADLHKENYFIVVMPHWGDEYASTTNTLVRSQARQLVSAGANIIAGSHPHVVQERVWMGDVPVIYSLGNLLFDQHFSKAVDTGNIAEFEMVKLNDKVKITQSKIYETSLASKRGIDVDFSPVDF